ncbi:Putative inactive carboxylesterase 4,Cholinesterase 2,Cholinesterase,Acetylcholinesterase [Mytilus edulis]|uniref:Carboxylic ester hydrolase n=1 Tax=Mytilus edulis TaxID=6550 RepID=A0A8S3TE47_MYTED|nr:Putative inactive carboxylesterase 4,Cholinesterase 2,Cholinesterase,Acetylcholinesterase [Mytilus edulis]
MLRQSHILVYKRTSRNIHRNQVRRMKNYVVVLVHAFTVYIVVSVDPEVVTTNGRIQGFEQASYSNKIVSTFLGIPFAAPPVGDLRFKRPEPLQNWSDTKDCKVLPNSCPQIKFHTFNNTAGQIGEEMWNYNTNSSEDCLYLNIWKPKTTSGNKLTTLVWIFGGGYIYGTSTLDLYDGTYLSAYADVIIASINYRVGPYGFLYMGNSEAPGNAGLLDQAVALEWIYNNIESFGGSKDSITIFGESAGAASVSYLMASDLSKNYFQRAILQSASLLSTWAYQTPDVAIKYAQLLADEVSCGGKSASETVQCLRQTSTDDLTNKAWNLPMTHVQWPFAPTLDNYFIHKSPTEIMKTDYFANKDILFGFNRDEGKEIPYIVSQDGLSFINGDKDRLLFDAILLYYNAWSNATTSQYYFDVLDDIAGDFNFKCPVAEMADLLSRYPNRNGTLYGYFFDQLTSARDWPEWAGVLHGDEVEYVFGVPLKLINRKYSSNEQFLCRNMMDYWTDFAKTGHPEVQKWKQFTSDNHQYALLQGGREIAMETIDLTRTCLFWSQYIPRLKNTCVPFWNLLLMSWKPQH